MGQQLRKSRRRDDVVLGEALTDELVADYRERAAERAAAEAAEAARVQAELELEEAGRTRKLRERKKARACHCCFWYGGRVGGGVRALTGGVRAGGLQLFGAD